MLERYVIHTTKLCNMDCTYCYEDDKTSQYTWDEIENILTNIVESSSEKRCSVEFLGGEPLIAFKHIKATVAYLEAQEGFEVDHYVITTNGTIISDEIMQWLKDNPKVIVSISIDGGRVANMLRVYKTTLKTTLDDVVKNSKRFIEELGVERISSHMVTHPWNVYLVSKSLDYIYKLGFRDITVGIIESKGDITKEYADRLIQELHKVSMQMKRGEYADLRVDMLHYMREDTSMGKVYIKDPVTGKVLAETYGRSEKDITHTENETFKAVRTTSDASVIIREIREQVYNNHKRFMSEA